MNWYLQVLKKYVVFSGRARRKEYWMYTLFNLIFVVIAAVIDNILGTTFEINTVMGPQALPYGYFYLLYALCVFLPSWAVTFRRLHDIGKSGWMFLIILIPLAGLIWFLVLMVKDSDAGENKYGANPKEIAG